MTTNTAAIPPTIFLGGNEEAMLWSSDMLNRLVMKRWEIWAQG